MTNYNNTDKIIREKYESIDPVFDAESMWADLSPLIEKKRRRGFIFWILSGAMILVLGLLTFNLFNRSVNSSSITEVVNEIKLDSKGLELSSNNSSISIVAIEVNSSSNDEGIIETAEVDVIDRSNKEVEASDSVGKVFAEMSALFTDGSNFYLDSKQVDQPITSIDFARSNNEIVSSSNSFSSADEVFNESRDLITFSTIDIINIPSLEYTTNRVVNVNSEWIESPYTQPLLKKQWRVGVNGGYYIHSRSFDNTSDDPSDNYSSRSMEEKAKDGYDLGVKVEYFLSNNFVIIGGVRFSQSFVQRKADYAYTETITLEDHVVTIINTEEGTIEVKEDITYDGVFNHKADNYVTATRFGLITGIQYRIGSDRWTTHIDLGVELPVWNSYSGIITNNRRPYNLSNDTEAINTSSIQIFGGIGMEYALSESTALQATIGGYMPLNNEHVESYAIQKKSTLLGLNLGVLFRL